MALFSKIGSLYDETPADSVGDDNSAISSAENNPYLAATVLGARSAYDTLHRLIAPMIEGKKASLRDIDRQLKKWVDQLEKVEEMYKELLQKLDDVGADFVGTFTLDFAKEAWEIVQDTPILRRYMGEANYWYLHDMVGLLATQSGSMAADVVAGVKSAIKAAILALLSMTEGLLCLESYLGLIQQWWGGLYLKIIPVPLLDSIVPNVTAAYWYKPAVTSEAPDGTVLTNNPPGQGFSPIPIPIPDPNMAVNNPGYIGNYNPQNPSTWMLDGHAYYIPQSMDLMYKALNYWGSSYTDAWLPIVNNIYPRRPYDRDRKPETDEDHPLRVGHTFAQLDKSKMSINGTDIQSSTSGTLVDVASIFEDVFSENMLEDLNAWQTNYVNARRVFISTISEFASENDIELETIGAINKLKSSNESLYNALMQTLDDRIGGYLLNMAESWSNLANTYIREHNVVGVDGYQAFYDNAMSAFIRAGHSTSGYKGSITEDLIYMSAPSYFPDNLDGTTDDFKTKMGVPFIAYTVNPETGMVVKTNTSTEDSTQVNDGDVAYVTYDVDSTAFVMFPSTYVSSANYASQAYYPSYVARKLSVTMIGLPAGTELNKPDVIGDTGTIVEYMFSQGMVDRNPNIIGELPDALYMHKSCGVDEPKASDVMGTMLFPNGKIPELDAEEGNRPQTFVTLYSSFMKTSSDVNEELADVVGYSIDHGREIKFPCFGVYGEFLSMQSWHYTEMPTLEFISQYTKIKSGSSLYYNNMDPSKVVYRHSNYFSQSRFMDMTVYHEPLDFTTKSYGKYDQYTFYVFPCESISVVPLSDGPNLGRIFSTEAMSPDGKRYHYITMRNPIPKCAKYVDADKWSIMDIFHEMYLLAYHLSGLCGDNGARLKTLTEDLAVFNISEPKFIGQLPENNGQYVSFHFGIFDEYAEKIEELVNSVYNFRSDIIAITENW